MKPTRMFSFKLNGKSKHTSLIYPLLLVKGTDDQMHCEVSPPPPCSSATLLLLQVESGAKLLSNRSSGLQLH